MRSKVFQIVLDPNFPNRYKASLTVFRPEQIRYAYTTVKKPYKTVKDGYGGLVQRADGNEMVTVTGKKRAFYCIILSMQVR